MSNNTGNNPHSPTRYLGPAVNFVPSVTRDRAPSGADFRQPETGKLYPIGTEWIVGKNPTSGTFGDVWFLSKIVANVATWINLGDGEITLTGDDGTVLHPSSANFNIYGQTNSALNPAVQVMETNGSGSTLFIEDRTSTTPLVVDASTTIGSRGTFSTIQSAIDAAVSGQTIFIKSGIYEENVTLKAGVNLATYGNSGFTPTVTIKGKCSFASEGFVTISGLALQSNGDYALSVTGSAASRIYLIECNVIAEDFAAIYMDTTGSGASIRLVNCWCRTNAVATNFFVVTGVGGLTFWNVNVIDGGATAQSTPSTFASTGQLLVKYSIMRFPITTSGTGRISGTSSEFNTFATNSVPLVVNATGAGGTLGNYVRGCIFLSGTAAALSVGPGSTINMEGNSVITTNSSPFTGTGTINQSGTSYSNTTAVPNSTTVTLARKAFDPGALWGNWNGVAPATGFVGEIIRSKVQYNSGSVVTLADGVVSNVTFINLTPGTWDVSGIVMFTGITTGTYQDASIDTTSATISNSSYGENTTSATFTNTTGNDVGLTIPPYRINVPVGGGNITVYLMAQAGFTVGTAKAYGTIRATRVV